MKKLLIVRIVFVSQGKKKASCKNLHTTIQLNPIFFGHGTQFPRGLYSQVQPHVHTEERGLPRKRWSRNTDS